MTARFRKINLHLMLNRAFNARFEGNVTIEEEYRLIRAAKKNNREAQQALLDQFHHMLCGAADKYRARLGFKEMYQVAALSFLECVRLFDTKRKPPLRLMTYGMLSVYRRCADEHRRGNRVITVPKYTAPSLKNEVDKALGAFSYTQDTASGSAGFADEIVYQNETSVPDAVSTKIEIEDMMEKFSRLTPKQQYVLRRRMVDEPFHEICKVTGNTRQRAEQIGKMARERLREMYEAEKEHMAIA